MTRPAAVVTGANAGIGRAVAEALAVLGHPLILACRSMDRAAPVVAAIRESTGNDDVVAVRLDLSDLHDVVRCADEIGERAPIDVLVNNAGVGIGGPFLDASTEDWDWLMGINLDGVAYGCRAFGPAMVDRGHGHVVNIASAAAYTMSRDMAAYCASKAAVVAFSRCLRADWSGSGVGVSVICPGVINTPIPSATRMFGPLAGSQERIQRRFRFGHSPDVVAKAIVKAAEKNHAVVPVGLESEVAYRLLPFVPGPVQALMTRTSLGSVL